LKVFKSARLCGLRRGGGKLDAGGTPGTPL
jgi:hypothetical protein